MMAGVRIDTKAFELAMADIYRQSDRSNMWALREAGRQVKRQARRKVRVYGGTTKSVSVTSRKSFRVTTGTRGADGKRAYGATTGVTPGLLRDSINSSRRLQDAGPRTYRLTVGPRGGHAFLYAAKIEALDHYMQSAYDLVAPKFPLIQEAAMARVLAKYAL